jgi:hypothetical protein
MCGSVLATRLPLLVSIPPSHPTDLPLPLADALSFAVAQAVSPQPSPVSNFSPNRRRGPTALDVLVPTSTFSPLTTHPHYRRQGPHHRRASVPPTHHQLIRLYLHGQTRKFRLGGRGQDGAAGSQCFTLALLICSTQVTHSSHAQRNELIQGEHTLRPSPTTIGKSILASLGATVHEGIASNR